MSKRSLVAAATVLAMLATLGVSGLAAAQDAPPSPEAGRVTFTMGSLEDLHSANPFAANAISDYEVLQLTTDMLYGFKVEDLTPVSSLAEWPPEHSADGKTWTIKVESGIRWSDGEPLTAADIAFTYNFINEKHIGTYSSELGDPIAKNAFEAPDDTTLIWHMAKASLAPEHPPYIPIVPEHIWGRFWDSDNKAIKAFRNVPSVGSGPFILTEWKEGQYWKYEVNPNYWGPKPHIDEVIMRVFDNPEGIKLALTSGEIDAAENVPPPIFSSIQEDPNITTNIGAGTVWDSLAFNFEGNADPSLRDQDVRTALAHSIDKQALVDRVLLGYGIPGDSVVAPPFARWYWQPDATQVIGYDPAKAMSLLDQAGYKDADDDGWRDTPQGDKWDLEVLAISDWPDSVPEAKLIQGWFRDVGIETSLKVVSQGKAYDLWGKQDFDMYVWGWSGNADPDFIMSIFTSKQCLWWSDGCYKDPVYDKMYLEQATTVDEEKRREILVEMQQYLYEKIPDVVLLYANDLQVYRNDRFTGFVQQPAGNGFIFYSWSPVSYLNIRPVTEAAGGASGGADGGSGGSSPIIWIAIVGIVLVVIVVLVMRRGKGGSAERE